MESLDDGAAFDEQSDMLDRITDGRTDEVVDLVEAGGAATTKDRAGTPIIRWCAYYGDVSGVKYLLTHGESLISLGRDFGLTAACFHGHWRLCQFLVEQGANVNHVSPDTNETPLHSALCKPNRPLYNRIVRMLLAHGADPRRATKHGAETGAFMRDCRTQGETPLHRAAAFANEEMLDLLLSAGASKEARDMNGDFPVTWASWHRRPGNILQKLSSPATGALPECFSQITSDHGCGWGDQAEITLLGRPPGLAGS